LRQENEKKIFLHSIVGFMSRRSQRLSVAAAVGVLLIISAFYFRPGGSKPVAVNSGRREIMGTFGHVIAVADNIHTANKCIDQAFARLRLVDELMSDYKVDSEISTVNRDAYKTAVRVSKDTFEVLQEAEKFAGESNGAFDVTVGPLVDLWHKSAETNSVPTDVELAEVKERIGYEKLLLDANDRSVRFAVDAMRLDLGGIAKGYAIDLAVEAMKNCGAIGAMVEIGGEIRCFGVPPKGRKKWLVGLTDPRRPGLGLGDGEILLVLNLADAAIATSGNYQRYIEIKGKKYNHIISPATGAGAGELSSVTVISTKAIEADALATAVTILGLTKGLELIESLVDVEAILISSEPGHELIQTKNAYRYIHDSDALED